ncbi:CUB domain-containing protein 1a [Misgurnus anguillicaudatus]|uniref:CUB domain-containing protein 1a n=1 Tax=Misgurnus anguillicaudatus TaxID=75329 RepID=UPI003CCF87CA
MRMWRYSVPLLLGFFLSALELTECAVIKISVKEGTTIHINPTASTKCKVCIQQKQQVCQSSVVLKSDTLLDFDCLQPEKVFNILIFRDIGQTVRINIEPKDDPAFQRFNRTFIWNLKALSTNSFNLNFSRMGLQQIRHTDSCPDKHIYTLRVMNVSIGRFCQNGSIRQVDIQNIGKLSLEVSGGQRLDGKRIDVSLGLKMNSLAHFHINLQVKRTTQDFFSPQYPDSFPSNAETVWSFTVPPAYYTSVNLLNYTAPTCLQPTSTPTMTYTWKGKDPVVKRLNAPQPSTEPGNFSLSLKNCQMSKLSQKGLRVNFQVSTIKKSRVAGQCAGDLVENEMLQIRVKRKSPKSACVLKSNSFPTDTVTIASGSHFELYFIDCNKDELELTVNITIECKEWQKCTNILFPLHFFYEQNCIQGVVKTITWHLDGPENSAVELLSSTDGLGYSLPEQKCDSNVHFDVSHVDRGITVGQFCPKGPIQSIKIYKSMIAVTVSFASTSDHSLVTNLIMNYLFRQAISEHYIFTVAPRNDYPALLATPAWPSEMKPSYTVSWIVTLESKFKSKLVFRNVSQPKCKEVNASIVVQSIHSKKMLYSNKNDENIKDLPLLESFYLNMTNCKSPTGAFRAMMQITLQSNTNQLLGIILGIMGILLAVVITAMVLCFVFRQKKRQNKDPSLSIYNPNEHAVLPGLHVFPRTLEKEDSHHYDYIDDTLVYSDLRKDDIEEG